MDSAFGLNIGLQQILDVWGQRGLHPDRKGGRRLRSGLRRRRLQRDLAALFEVDLRRGARQRLGEAEAVPPPPESLAQLPSLQPAAASGGFSSSLAATSVTTDSYAEAVSTVTVDAPPNAEFAPELLARPELSPSTVAKFIRVSAPRPNTFLELLDASLSLGRD